VGVPKPPLKKQITKIGIVSSPQKEGESAPNIIGGDPTQNKKRRKSWWEGKKKSHCEMQ